jgi:3-deoxy-D-manno-octulosonic-acid transferase
MYFLYSAVLTLAALLSSPWWLLNLLRHGKHRMGLAERLGFIPAHVRLSGGEPGPNQGTIWLHAVSVGEVLASAGLVAALRARFPDRRIVISTTTAAGQVLARQRFGEANVFFVPLDFAFAIRPWLRALRPELLILAETEFWPNFLRLARQSGCRIAVVNARISDRSFPRYRLARRFFQHVLANVDVFLAQSEQDRLRLLAMGASPQRTHVSGNLKFETPPPPYSPLLEMLRRQVKASASHPVLVFGSTVEGEDELLLPVIGRILQQFPDAMVILAPRHPERFQKVADLLEQSGFRFWRRSQWTEDITLRGGVFLLDSIGELASLYSLAAIAFVGGSLVPRGGHNILEPAQAGVAIVVGPHTENFRDILSIFRNAGAVKEVTAAQLSPLLLHLLQHEDERSEIGRRAEENVRLHSGATMRTLAALENLLDPANKKPASSPPLQPSEVR